MQPSNNTSFAYATRSQSESSNHIGNNNSMSQNVNIPFDLTKAGLPGSRQEAVGTGSFAAPGTAYPMYPPATQPQLPSSYRMPLSSSTNSNNNDGAGHANLAHITPLAPPVALSAMSLPASHGGYPGVWSEVRPAGPQQQTIQPQQQPMIQPGLMMSYTQPQQLLPQPMSEMRAYPSMMDGSSNNAMSYTGGPVANTSFMAQLPSTLHTPAPGAATMAQYMSASALESGRPSEADNRAWYSAMSSPRSSLNAVDQPQQAQAQARQQQQYVMTPELWPGLVGSSGAQIRPAHNASTPTTGGTTSTSSARTLSASDVSLLQQVSQSSAFIQHYLAEESEVSTEARQHVAALLERVKRACEQTVKAERDVAAAEKYFHKMAAVEAELMQLMRDTQATFAASSATDANEETAAGDAAPQMTGRNEQGAPGYHSMSSTTGVTSGSGMQRITADLVQCAALTQKLEQLEIALRVLEDQHDALQKRYLLDTPRDWPEVGKREATATEEDAQTGYTSPEYVSNDEQPESSEAALASHWLQARQRAVRERLLDELLLQRREEATCQDEHTRETLLIVYVPVVGGGERKTSTAGAPGTSSPGPAGQANEAVLALNTSHASSTASEGSTTAGCVMPVLASPTRYAEVQLALWLGERLQRMAGRLEQVVRGREGQLHESEQELHTLDAYDPARELALRRREQAMQELQSLRGALVHVTHIQERTRTVHETMYEALRNQAMLRRCLLEALAQRLDEEERHRQSLASASAPSVRSTAVPEADGAHSNNNTITNTTTIASHSNGGSSGGNECYAMGSVGSALTGGANGSGSGSAGGTGWRFSEITSNPAYSTRTSMVLQAGMVLPRASDVFRAMLEQIAASHAPLAPPPIPSEVQVQVQQQQQQLAASEPANTSALDQTTISDAVNHTAQEKEEEEGGKTTGVSAEDEKGKATLENEPQVVIKQEAEVEQPAKANEEAAHEPVVPDELQSCVEQETTDRSVAERLNRTEALLLPAESKGKRERTERVTQSDKAGSSSEEDDDGSAAARSNEVEEEEYSLRNGTLLRGLTALVKAVVKRAVTFGDEDDEDEERVRQRGRKRVRREQ